MQRRKYLATISATLSGLALAGCSSNGDEGDGGGDGGGGGNENTDDTSGPTETDTEEANETESPTPTQTSESRFSTDGNDSDRFNLSEEEKQNLLLTASDLPGTGWEEVGTNGYRRETEQGNQVLVDIGLAVEESVSEARTRYEERNSLVKLGVVTQEIEPDQTQELSIAVESRWQVLTGESEDESEVSAGMVIFRDANAIGVLILSVNGSADSDLVSLDTMGSLGVTFHQKWR